MKLSVIVKRLRDTVPLFQRRVDGLVEYADVDLTRNFPMPCAFVVPTGENVTETTYYSEYIAQCESNFSVYVFLSPLGHEVTAGYDLADDVKMGLVKSLAGYRVGDYGIRYDGFEVEKIDRLRIVLRVDFVSEYAITNEMTAEEPDISEFDQIHVEYPNPEEQGDYVPESVINLKEG